MYDRIAVGKIQLIYNDVIAMMNASIGPVGIHCANSKYGSKPEGVAQ